jgi:hypothetical protein
MHPLAPLVSIMGVMVMGSIKWSTTQFDTLLSIERTTGQSPVWDTQATHEQAVDLSTMDFGKLLKAVHFCIGNLRLFELTCEETIESLSQVLHILDRYQGHFIAIDPDMTALQTLQRRLDYYVVSHKALLLRLRSNQKRCKTQLSVVILFLSAWP